MIKKIYKWLYNFTAKSEEKGKVFGGRIQGAVRDRALGICESITGRVLEVGSGSGLFILRLASLNPSCDIYGVDKDARLISLVRAKAKESGINNLDITYQDAFKLSFEDGYFDTVVCINFSINFDIDKIARLVKELSRITRSGGRLIFEFRNSRNLLFRLKYSLVHLYDPTIGGKLYMFTESQMEDLFKKYPLKIVKKHYLGFPVKSFAPIIIFEARKI